MEAKKWQSSPKQYQQEFFFPSKESFLIFSIPPLCSSPGDPFHTDHGILASRLYAEEKQISECWNFPQIRNSLFQAAPHESVLVASVALGFLM